jgi:hypothetical protein
MTKTCESTPEGMSPPETIAILHKILESVERNPRRKWLEITCAVVLAMATVSSAWCAYESTLWGGVQTFRLAAAAKAGREGSAAHIEALQWRAFDAAMFIEYVQAKHDGNVRNETFLLNRFRPEMKRAVDAWLKTDPFNNTKAPEVPFRMAEYSQLELEEANRLGEMYAREHAAADQANRNSDTYVLLTTLFATVLFFGGIAGTVDSHRLRKTILSIAVAVFVGTFTALGTMPICRE